MQPPGPGSVRREREGDRYEQGFVWNCIGGFFGASTAYGGLLDGFLEKINPPAVGDADQTISALKEALSIGTGKAVEKVSLADGYLSNEAIKILMPEKIQNVADMLKKVGYGNQVDAFILSMNRAAEAAAPKAKSYFIGAIKEMTFSDARKILNGGDTAATDYLRSKTFKKIYAAFKPTVASSLDQVGGTRAYKDMMRTFTSLPFISAQSFDLDHYVTDRSLQGLFYMTAQEEKKIRTDPTARVTDLLKNVFGK